MGDIQVVLWLSQWFRIVSFDSVAFNFCTPQKASVGMIADAYALQILFVYFLILPSLLHPSILLFFILVSVLFLLLLA